MHLVDGGCFATLGNSLVAMDLSFIEEFAQESEIHTHSNMASHNYCLVEGTKPGLWFLFGLVDESGLCSLMCLAAGEVDAQLINASYIVSLPWEPFKDHCNQNIKVPSGNVGLFCVESIKKCIRNHDLHAGDYRGFLGNWSTSMQQLTMDTAQICLADIPNGPVGAMLNIGNSESCRCEFLNNTDGNEIWGWRIVF
ncbi:uncharacterized protein BdWA1_003565 [Babesia duncani]|uniref:Uncharacterized protein n=1 Tax=Babesia duncani TaxID=323732 RepID=A0AAD9PGI7_9APIC|nr:hypothetical protein BdWA1_004130 [Babesia duncani]KAK2194641.1 hypothetical protein BdWA1_003880 [Babesia duncani]KAK2194973.1 hypothetical protein BdWA1_003565 [Babesia duncani]